MKNKLKEILTKKYNFEAESTEYSIKDADDSDDYIIMTRVETKQYYLDEFKKYENFYKNLINKIDNIKTEKEILDLSRQDIDIIGHKIFLINYIEIE
jgi:formaldehyde-activating enzyme involved in methanogenesis